MGRKGTLRRQQDGFVLTEAGALRAVFNRQGCLQKNFFEKTATGKIKLNDNLWTMG
jgi:hypothetical protein